MLSIQLLGTFQLSFREETISLTSTKAQELFCYLLLNRQRQHRRAILAEQLWGAQDSAQARKHLRQSLWQLQSSLYGDVDYVLTIEDWLSVNPDAPINLDIATFDDVYQQTQGSSPYDLTAAQIYVLDDALRLYRGQLLTGWGQNWCFGDRERFFNTYLRMANKLIAAYRARHQYDSAIITVEEVLQHEPAHEYSYQQLMYLYYLLGDRTSAMRQYDRCRYILATELDIKPSQTSTNLYEKIRTDTLDVQQAQMPANNLLVDLQAQLQSLTASIDELQQRIDGAS